MVLTGPFVLNASPTALLERAKKIEECCFELLRKRVHLLIPRSKWFTSDSIFVNDICLFFLDDCSFKSRCVSWHYGRVTAISGIRLTIEYTSGSGTKKLLERSKRQVVRIASEDELNFNTKSHFDSISKPSGFSKC